MRGRFALLNKPEVHNQPASPADRCESAGCGHDHDHDHDDHEHDNSHDHCHRPDAVQQGLPIVPVRTCGHGHSHGHGHIHAHGASINLGIAFGLNLLFTIIEFAGGYWTNSIAITTDAVHDLGDCLSLGLAWWLQIISRQPRSPRFTYGMARLSPLGAFLTGIVLIFGLVYVMGESVQRLWDPQTVAGEKVVLIAILGLVFNGFAAWRLHGGMTLNEQVASWHLWEDTLGWAAVLVGGAIMSIWHVPLLDPLLAIGLAVFVLWNVSRNLWRVGELFLQALPEGMDAKSLESMVQSIAGVQKVENLHAWTLDGERHVLTIRVTCSPATFEEVEQVKSRIREKTGQMGFESVTIET